MTEKMPFSVLISVYKNERAEYLHQSLQSIWDYQTLKPDEIVLVKDGPLNEELDAVVGSWQAKLGNVLKVVPLVQNVGLGMALNEGLKHCTFELVARMDSDDISLPNRFEIQVPFMQARPELAVSSAWIEEVDVTGQIISTRKLPSDHESILKLSKSRGPINHAVAIFRKHAVDAVGGYPQTRIEDYALWSLLLVKGYRFENLPEVLYRVRMDADFFQRRGFKFLMGELDLLNYQIEIGFISRPIALRNAAIRSVVRLSPTFVKKMFYKIIRLK